MIEVQVGWTFPLSILRTATTRRGWSKRWLRWDGELSPPMYRTTCLLQLSTVFTTKQNVAVDGNGREQRAKHESWRHSTRDVRHGHNISTFTRNRWRRPTPKYKTANITPIDPTAGASLLLCVASARAVEAACDAQRHQILVSPRM